jgi:kynurenine formamidase
MHMLLKAGVAAALIVTAALLSSSGTGDGRRTPLTAAELDRLLSSVSNWGRWGKDDQLGALNLITPEKRRQAAALVKEGHSVSLAHKALEISPQFVHHMVATGTAPGSESAADSYSFQYHGYMVTHLDALCHLFHKGQMYNGFSQREVSDSGAARNSVIHVQNGLFTRGVLMDLPRLLGVNYLPGKKAVYPEDLDAWEKKAGLRVSAGDAILIRTGRWARRAAQGDWNFESDSAGLDASCVRWLHSRDVAVLGSDLASDVMPSGSDAIKMPVHLGAIWAMGVPILDNCDFEKLGDTAAQRNRWEFLLTAAPLAVDGGTGSPINPIAVF